MKKRILSMPGWWFLVTATFCAGLFDISDASAIAMSSTSKKNDKSKLLSSDQNMYGKGDKSIKAGGGDIHASVKGREDIIPIPDHLLNSDYEHQYSYEDGNIEGYDYEDDYHYNSGKHKGITHTHTLDIIPNNK